MSPAQDEGKYKMELLEFKEVTKSATVTSNSATSVFRGAWGTQNHNRQVERYYVLRGFQIRAILRRKRNPLNSTNTHQAVCAVSAKN